jgi:tetratricopeptide (TPR) repeat protein
MADGERRMLFDIRGRRKNVVKVVYGILAVMMGASLFLVVGPVNIGSLLSTSDEVNRSADIFDEQNERIEQRLRKDPQNPDILISLTRTRINAARAKSELDPTTGETRVNAQARVEYEKANEAWARYLKVADEPSPSVAALVSGAAFVLAQNSKTYEEAIEHLGEAADAQRRRLDDPGRLRVPRRQQGRRGQGGQGSTGAGEDEAGKEDDLQTAHRLRKAVERNTKSQGGSRKGRKGQRQGNARKPARRVGRFQPDDDHALGDLA